MWCDRLRPWKSKKALDQLTSMGKDGFVVVEAAGVCSLARQARQLSPVSGELDQILGQCAAVPDRRKPSAAAMAH